MQDLYKLAIAKDSIKQTIDLFVQGKITRSTFDKIIDDTRKYMIENGLNERNKKR